MFDVTNPTIMAIWNTIKANQVLLILVFIAFLIIAKKLFNILTGSITTAIIAATFPFVLNRLGFDISTNFDTIMYFMLLGVALYVIYHIISGVLKIGKIFR